MTAPAPAATRERRLLATPGAQPPLLFAGLAVASAGGPLALVALYLPGVLAGTRGSPAATALAGVLAFAAPTLIWCRYSTRVAGPGGLAAFTRAAAGRRLAQVQAALWVTSYLLYLLYTTDYVVTDVLPAAAPGLTGWGPALEVALPLVIVGIVLAPLRTVLALLTVSALGQVALSLVLIEVGATQRAVTAAATAGTARTGKAAAEVGLLFICTSLPVFLGGEVAGRGRTVQRSLAWTVAGVGALVVAAALPAAALSRFASADLPGTALARAAGLPGLGVVIGIGVAVSILSLVIVEYLALTRITHAFTARPTAAITRWIAVPLVASSLISLAVPGRLSADLLRPSLVALWLAQLIPVVVYPRFARRTGGLRPSDLVATAVGTALLVYGLHASLSAAAGS